jgi:hypothetical protein
MMALTIKVASRSFDSRTFQHGSFWRWRISSLTVGAVQKLVVVLVLSGDVTVLESWTTRRQRQHSNVNVIGSAG